jgi:hypothetical protein
MNMIKRLATVAAIAGLFLYGPAQAQTPTIVSSPAITTTALSTTSAQIIGTNPSRKGIIICNPSSIVEWIAPSPATAVAAAGIGLPAASSGTTVCLTIGPTNAATVGNSWNGIAASSTPNITVLELF